MRFQSVLSVLRSDMNKSKLIHMILNLTAYIPMIFTRQSREVHGGKALISMSGPVGTGFSDAIIPLCFILHYCIIMKTYCPH